MKTICSNQAIVKHRERDHLKLLILGRYDRQGASSRVRVLQYSSYLQDVGFSISFKSFFSADYLKALYSGHRPLDSIVRAYVARMRDLQRAQGRFDLVLVQKEALPWAPSAIEARLMPKGVPVVFDYDDAVFHRYDLHPSWVVRLLLGRKISDVIRRSDLVLAGNEYLAAYARTAKARRLEIVPTVLDTSTYRPAKQDNARGGLTVGWVGTPVTWQDDVADFIPSLRQLAEENSISFKAVGAKALGTEGSAFSFPGWSEESELGQIQSMDIGVMPLSDTPYTRGKCGYKLLQYMACGLPVVASPVGVNTDIVEHGVNGFLADSDDDWRSALTTLINNPDLRRKMGAAGRQRVEKDYSLQVYGPRVAALLRSVATSATSPERAMAMEGVR